MSLSAVEHLILDEADRMLDMGFGPAIQSIIESDNAPTKDKRQTLMLSATFPESIQTLAAVYLRDYLFVTVGRVGGASTDIVQTMLEIPGSEKRSKLEEILLESGKPLFISLSAYCKGVTGVCNSAFPQFFPLFPQICKQKLIISAIRKGPE